MLKNKLKKTKTMSNMNSPKGLFLFYLGCSADAPPGRLCYLQAFGQVLVIKPRPSRNYVLLHAGLQLLLGHSGALLYLQALDLSMRPQPGYPMTTQLSLHPLMAPRRCKSSAFDLKVFSSMRHCGAGLHKSKSNCFLVPLS